MIKMNLQLFGGRGSGSGKSSGSGFNEQKFANELEMYVGGGYGSVKDALSEENFQHIKDNMTEYSDSLYRIEDYEFTAGRLELDEGDTFSFTDDLRSFTRSSNYAKKIVSQGMSEDIYEVPVMFQTVGTVKHFNMDKYASGYYENQHESLAGGKFKVIGTDMKNMNGQFIYVYKIKQV